MYYSEIKWTDIANGPGVRVTIFASGCSRHCKGCFNPETWNYMNGEEFTMSIEDKIIKQLKLPFIKGLTLLGGEPFDSENYPALLALCNRAKEECPDKNIWAYTGYKLDELGKHPLLSVVDILVDGPFIEDLYSIDLQFKGSTNQRIIDLKASAIQGGIVEWKDYYDRGKADRSKAVFAHQG